MGSGTRCCLHYSHPQVQSAQRMCRTVLLRLVIPFWRFSEALLRPLLECPCHASSEQQHNSPGEHNSHVHKGILRAIQGITRLRATAAAARQALSTLHCQEA